MSKITAAETGRFDSTALAGGAGQLTAANDRADEPHRL